MAVFDDTKEDWNRLDFRLLRDHPVTLYRNPAILDEDLQWLTRQGYRLHRFNSERWVEIESFHDDVSRELKFPGYYGRNLNAFDDCLSDLEVPLVGGVILVFDGFDTFAAAAPDPAWAILDIIAGRSRKALLFGARLLAAVQSNDPRIQFDTVGATPVGWNPREWEEKARRL